MDTVPYLPTPRADSAEAEAFTVVADCSLSMGRANLYALLFAVPLVVPTIVAFAWLHGADSLQAGAEAFFSLAVFLPSVVAGVVVHELIHGLSWAVVGRLPWRQVRFGFQVKTLTPFAHAEVPLPARVYRIGAVMPFLVLGAAPALLGIAVGSAPLTLFGVFMSAAAGGDLAILWTLGGVPSDALVQDHPTRAGCYIVQPAFTTGA